MGRLMASQVASRKTQLLGVSRTAVVPNLQFYGETLVAKDEVEVMGVTYNYILNGWSEKLLASLRRISPLLDAKGLEVLNKA